jgi:hypothetical protein
MVPAFVHKRIFFVALRKELLEGLAITSIAKSSVNIFRVRIFLTSPEDSIFGELELASGEICLLESPTSCLEWLGSIRRRI